MKKYIFKIISVILAFIVVVVPVLPSVFASAANKTVFFGEYPQTQVNDSAVCSELEQIDSEWISYNYYPGNGDILSEPTSSDFMVYKDVVYNGVKYRGVYFSDYRAYSTHETPDKNYQQENGFTKNTTCWFRFEPLEWIVLDEQAGLCVTKYTIDSQAFADKTYLDIFGSGAFRADSTDTSYPNNYEKSTIRKWLNEYFLNNAFSDIEKKRITAATITNTADDNLYSSPDTQDNIFLFSKAEIGNSAFFSEPSAFPSYSTDYALAQGLKTTSDGTAQFTMLRTGASSEVQINAVTASGAYTGMDTYCTYFGIRPAIYLNPAENTCKHNYHSETVAPDCVNEGSVIYTCSLCNDSYSETIPATGHKETVIKGTPATCTVTGLSDGIVCSVCKTVIKAQSVTEKTDHSYRNIEAKEPTCEEAGNTFGCVCSVCGYELISPTEISATGHISSIRTGYAATCDSDGRTEEEYCSICNKILRQSVVIPATGHSIVTDSAVKETCTTNGKTSGSHCEKCGAVIEAQTVIPSTGHNAVEDAAVAVTCINDGLTVGYHCSVCGEVIIAQNRVLATGHTPASAVPENFIEPACTVNGGYDNVIRCKTCNDVISSTHEVIPSTGHIFENYTSDNNATCTDDGTKTAVCRICNASDTIPDTGSVKGHAYEDSIVPPTCTSQGYTIHECKECGDCISDNFTAQLEHSFTAESISKETLVKPATCTAKAEYCYSCSVCGAIGTTTFTAGETADHIAGAVVTENKAASTCTKQGSYDSVIYCTACKTELSRKTSYTKALGHSYSDTVTAPTCTAQGYTTHECSVCGNSYIDSYTQKKEHDFTAKTLNPTTLANAATCTAKAEYYYSCSVCCATGTTTFTAGETAEHIAGPVATENKAASTCTKQGSYDSVIYCTACKTELSRKTSYTKALGHSYSDTVTAPTCTAQGFTTHKCSKCGYSYYDSIISATGHIDADKNGICDICLLDSGYRPQVSCSHICHKDGFVGFIWKTMNFFNRIFRIKQFCSCGAKHW